MRAITVPLKLIDLQDDGFHLLVEIVVFGEKLLAVVDTGASRSVFDKAFIKQHIDITETEQSHAITLFSTTSILQATIPEVKLGRLRIKDYYAIALELDGVNETYESLGHPPIVAILGSDIFLKYQAIINFKKLKLYLYNV
ncbi:aspartyl protease family protein [Pedobacter sp. JCM 36344]|uniref:aspartyl protease family protein n=1 Tax=Pedobacter sp. JCM 36344 TaxID=3374280 RepID=UPI00397E0340